MNHPALGHPSCAVANDHIAPVPISSPQAIRTTCTAWEHECKQVTQHAAVMEGDQEQLLRLMRDACGKAIPGIAAIAAATVVSPGAGLGVQPPQLVAAAAAR